jgi:DNA-binding transcriptional ArsR family regulator
MWEYNQTMPRAVMSSDVFHAVAESHRRAILKYLAPGERPVGDVVAALRLAQPSASKHLRVLREADLVRSRRDGRRMLYRTNAEAIKPLHEWAGIFEHYWRKQLSRIKQRAESTGRPTPGDGDRPNKPRTPNR